YLHGRVRAGDVLARMGGDEFALLASDIDEDSALALAKDIVKDLNQRPFTLSGEHYRVGASAGVAMVDQRSVSAYEAMREADIACYVSKHAGRGRAHLFSRGDRAATRTVSEMKLFRDIRDAMTEQRLRIVYQPIVAVADGRVSHYEVLLRMARRDGTLESTSEVITAAERYGVIGELDRWVIDAAIAELAAEHRHGRAIRLTINLSGISMGDPSLQGFIINALAQHQVSGERIVFEVTETAAISGMERAYEFMRELRTYGCQFALDDFGTGFSSYTHLKYLPLTYLKIDGSFIRGLVRDPVDQAMVRSMTAIAFSMGVATVAEYVENQEILDSLPGLGVRLAQGFHISRPLDSPRFVGQGRWTIAPNGKMGAT
ncbi:EAL domain-containing protein, partial [Aquisalimonas sp.]|uniref:putative bifunctional diguanylate cyclase/phosphodiesterase n=1 Tax=Aquisalimonas sp. TaxID=1872621 RepID=UPI0025B93D85